MELRPEYKHTAVGVIPAEWDVCSVGEMFRLVNGCAFKPQDWKETGTPIIRIQNLNDPVADYNYSQAPVPERNRVEPGDLLFAWSGTIGTSFGARIWAGPSGVLNQHIFKVYMDEERITLPFALLVFTRVEEDIAKQAHGFKASFVHVKKSDLVKVALPVPPLPEQRAIAEALSDVDALITSLGALIAKKRAIKRAAMQQLLTGQTRLPGFRGKWEVASLDMLTSRATGVWGKNEPDERNSHLVQIIRAGDISQDGRLTATATRYVAPEEFENAKCALDNLVITTSGNGLGKLWWCDGRKNIAASNFVRVLRPKATKVVGRFLCYALRTGEGLRQLQEHTATSAYPNLRATYFSTAWIPLPVPSEQAAIASVLSNMDAEIAALEARRDKTRAIKQGMMQQLLTGRIRLLEARAA